MKTSLHLAFIACVIASEAWSDEPASPVTSRIQSIGMFKNGLALVRRTVEVPGGGRYRLDGLPKPVHGTFWIESDAEVTTRSTTIEMDVPLGKQEAVSLQNDLSGQEVTVFFDGDIPPATGRVISPQAEVAEDKWSRNYETQYNWWSSYRRSDSTANPTAARRFLVLETVHGRAYVDKNKITYLQVKGTGKTVRRNRPVLLLEVAATDAAQVRVDISYLTKGIAWAPSYRVDITDHDELELTQKAVIKNELEGFKGASLQLISGFPSMQFSHVTSPLSLNTDWASFFSQLNTQVNPGQHALSNVMSQQVVTSNMVSPSTRIDLSAIPAGEGVDLNYQNIGPRTMRAGDALALKVASNRAEYERVVEWQISDTRNPDGQPIDQYRRNRDADKYDDSPWDAVRFKNPFEFPLTTGAAMVVANDQFIGQRTSYWVNSGEQTTLRITKALSVRTRHLEKESGGERDYVYVGGRRFRKVQVSGEIFINNHRDETVKMIVRRGFSGELLSADGDPETTLRETGVYSVNKRNELVWQAELKSGEEIKRTYEYEVLVSH